MTTTLLERAYHWEKTTPERVWLTQPIGGGQVRTYTFRQAMDEARRMAAHLASRDLAPKSAIAIIAKNSARFVLADLAIWMAGHVSVALYPTLSADTVRQILEHSEAKIVFLGKLDDWDTMKPGVPSDLPVIAFPLAPPNDFPKWDDLVKQHEPVKGTPSRDPEELAILVYTSGSTGKPKGVMHSFGAMAAAPEFAQRIFQVTQDDRMLSYLPLAHVYERAVVEAGSIYNGFSIFFADSLSTFLEDMQRARPTFFVSVPRLWVKFQLGVFQKLPREKLTRLLRIPILSGVVKKKVLKSLGLDSVRLALSGSAPIPPDVIHWYRSLGFELLEGYGMTEDFAYSHASLPGKSRVGYVGNASPGVEVKLSDEGEVLVKSPCNMMGYYKEPEMTAASYTPDGFFKTGDRGERDAEGRLKITGRVKELFKTSKGKYVAPAPIENLLNAHPYVELSCVTGSGEPQPHALVMLSEEMRAKLKDPSVRGAVTESLRALLKRVNDAVDPHEALGFIAVVRDEWHIENGCLTPTMKIKRAALEAKYGPSTESWYASHQPIVWE